MVNAMWKLKNLNVIHVHPMLQDVMDEIKKEWGLDIITCGSRLNDPRCHGTLCKEGKLRAVDLRMKNRQMGKHIESWVNALYQYDPKRPHMNVALWHKKHLHLQVYPTTRKRVLTHNGRYPV